MDLLQPITFVQTLITSRDTMSHNNDEINDRGAVFLNPSAIHDVLEVVGGRYVYSYRLHVIPVFTPRAIFVSVRGLVVGLCVCVQHVLPRHGCSLYVCQMPRCPFCAFNTSRTTLLSLPDFSHTSFF
jgi:hypothetical protein